MPSLLTSARRIRNAMNPPNLPKVEKPLRIGILGAARIAPDAIILPARSHPEVLVYAVAARSLEKAAKFAEKHGIEKVYGGASGYSDLLKDPDVDAVYNPLPNGLHFEWSMKALAAGKHVLLEKPSCNTADEARRLWAFAKEKNLVLLEAFHYRFHPAWLTLREIVLSEKLGKIKHIEASLELPSGIGVLVDNDIRLQYDLGGGCMMDMGVYPLSATREIMGCPPISVTSASYKPSTNPPDEKVDFSFTATLEYPSEVTATISANFGLPKFLGVIPADPNIRVKVIGEKGEVEMWNYIVPHYIHSIDVKVDGRKEKKKVYAFCAPRSGEGGGTDEDYWSTYRHMLEAFVDKIKGRKPRVWISGEDSIEQAEWVDKIYEKMDLPLRPNSTFAL